MEAFAMTDTGMVRTQNQDYYQLTQCKQGQFLAVVCDGMGGAKSGNVASRLAADVFTGEIKRMLLPETDPEQAEALLRGALALANTAVYEHAQLSDDFAGMGTTLVALLATEQWAIGLNVGDSRLYRINDDGIERISTDHSLVELMVQRGEITREEARNHPNKNVITRAVGTEREVNCDLCRLDVKAGDCFLLCTDGLSNLLADQEILFEVLHGAKKSDCCRRLVEIAKDRGAPDNVTAVLVIL